MITVERTDFISVPVTDVERSRAFYGDTLGLPQIEGQSQWPEFQLGANVSLYLVDPTNLGREWAGPHSVPFALRVADVPAAKEALEAKGIEFLGDVMDTTVCHMAIFADPDGNQIMLHRRYAPLPGTESDAS